MAYMVVLLKNFKIAQNHSKCAAQGGSFGGEEQGVLAGVFAAAVPCSC